MAIKASSAQQIDRLLADLASPTVATREAAVARLTVIGARAVERLIATVAAASTPGTRVAAWRALEAIGDTRALAPALAQLARAGVDVSEATAAVAVARKFLRGKQSAAALDRLTAIALDRARPASLRLAALAALKALPRATIAPVLASLAADPDADIRRLAVSSPAPARGGKDPAETVASAAEGLPDNPAELRRAIVDAGDAVSLTTLLRIVERVRDKESAKLASAAHAEWMTTRAAAHAALAARGSRLALYDLRESLAQAAVPLPVEFLSALATIGDASCLEATAAAYASSRDAWWRDHLAQAFRAIVNREKLTKRHAALRRIEKRSPQALAELLSQR